LFPVSNAAYIVSYFVIITAPCAQTSSAFSLLQSRLKCLVATIILFSEFLTNNNSHLMK